MNHSKPTALATKLNKRIILKHDSRDSCGGKVPKARMSDILLASCQEESKNIINEYQKPL